MKAVLSIILLATLCVSCEKNPKPDITGKWLRKDAPPGKGLNDTLYFYANGQAVLQGVDFQYTLHSDSIFFEYNGPKYIYCPSSAHLYTLSDSPPTLSLENLNKLCLINIDRGISIYQKLLE